LGACDRPSIAAKPVAAIERPESMVFFLINHNGMLDGGARPQPDT
jgi:hypothetical protein